MMRSGPLRHRVTFQERVETVTSTGALAVNWVDRIILIAADVIEQPTVSKAAKEPQTVTQADVIVRIRARGDVRTAMRIKWVASFNRGVLFFQIVGIPAAKNHGQFLDIHARLIEQEGLGRG